MPAASQPVVGEAFGSTAHLQRFCLGVAAGSVQSQNSTAATLAGVYATLVATAVSFVVHHSATAGGVFSVYCGE
jgi:hypothetical protein